MPQRLTALVPTPPGSAPTDLSPFSSLTSDGRKNLLVLLLLPPPGLREPEARRGGRRRQKLPGSGRMEAVKTREGGAAGAGAGLGEPSGCGCKGIRSCLLCEAAPPPQVTHPASEKGWRRGWELEGGRGKIWGVRVVGERESPSSVLRRELREPLRMCRVLFSQGKGGRIRATFCYGGEEVPTSGCRCIFNHNNLYIF